MKGVVILYFVPIVSKGNDVSIKIDEVSKCEVRLLLAGDLTDSFSIDVDEQLLSTKSRFVLQNVGITNWNQDSVIVLYTFLKRFLGRATFEIVALPESMQRLLGLVLQTPLKQRNSKANYPHGVLETLGEQGILVYRRASTGAKFLVQIIKICCASLVKRINYRKKDFWEALEDCGPKALSIVSLISFLVGLILAFVGALQLKAFGAQIYVASLVTIGMVRIMGAIMTGIIMAGRTGASYAATIGTMQVNEELDALQTMGISKSEFLVFPRMKALMISMPILVLISDFMGMLGGCCVGVLLWSIPLSEYIKYSVSAFNVENFFVGISHGLVFGFIIVLCSCYFGITCGRAADSVGKATTNSVVYSIVWMIIMTGVITLICEALGI